MIPQAYLFEWRNHAPWAEMHQVEQDLVLSRAIIELYSDAVFKEAFAFRGGTAMQKLFFSQPVRYSEDIDLVQIKAEPIGLAIDSIRKNLDPWLGTPKRSRKQDRVTLYYRFDSEIAPVRTMRLKIEINTGEHFSVLPLKTINFKAKSNWFSGEADLITYELEELIGTKMRALYQRKQGRDLFDLAMVLKHFPHLDRKKVIECFSHYMSHVNASVTRAQFEANLAEKMSDGYFTSDIHSLLATESGSFDGEDAATQVKESLLALLPGDPWKTKADKKSKKGSRT